MIQVDFVELSPTVGRLISEQLKQSIIMLANQNAVRFLLRQSLFLRLLQLTLRRAVQSDVCRNNKRLRRFHVVPQLLEESDLFLGLHSHIPLPEGSGGGTGRDY